MAIHKKDLVYILFTILIIVGAFFIHSTIIDTSKNSNFLETLGFSYLVNYSLYLLSLVGYFLFSKKLKNWVGYYFMSIMTVKILVLIALFMPDIKADGLITKKEFALLFVPYAICLVFTAKHLINKLR